jgi:hypothetical protein
LAFLEKSIMKRLSCRYSGNVRLAVATTETMFHHTGSGGGEQHPLFLSTHAIKPFTEDGKILDRFAKSTSRVATGHH